MAPFYGRFIDFYRFWLRMLYRARLRARYSMKSRSEFTFVNLAKFRSLAFATSLCGPVLVASLVRFQRRVVALR